MTDIVSISLSEELRSRLDEETARQRRSRSSVVAEAIAAYLDGRRDAAFEEARLRDLRENLELSPAARVRLSEELWHELTRGREVTEPFGVSFDSWREYETWSRAIEREGA